MKFPKQMIVAHRGASGLVKHENTIDAFQKAIDVHSDCIEIDIRKTKDNKIIVFHDNTIKNKPIKSLDYQELLEIAGFPIPTLEETLEFVKGKILIDIEFKESGYVEEAVNIIKKHLTNEEYYIRSFHDDVLVDVKKVDPKITTALLLGKDVKKHVFRTRMSELFPGRRICKTKCDFVSPHYRLLKFGFMWRMRIRKKPVSVWTINDEQLMRKLLLKVKVESLVTNYPDLAYKILQGK